MSIRIQKTIILASTIMALCSICHAAPTVSNVQARQDAASKVVNITYDLADPVNPKLFVSVQVSSDNGSTWTVPVTQLSGDVGSGVPRGTGKHIIWNCKSDIPDAVGSNYKVSVTASDSSYTGQMIYIPAGSFLMGNSGVGNDAACSISSELPQHSVYLAAYSIGKYEVTRGEYRAFMNAGGYSNSAYWSTDGWSWKTSNNRTQPYYWDANQSWGTGTFTQTDSYPVVGVSYYEAEAFCNWAGGHLPTEAQWEKAARWNASTGHPNVYPWGDTWNQEYCNNYYDSNSAGGGYEKYQTSPVGSYPSGASPYGCQDMAGNVWEWCQDWYKSYPGSSSSFDYTNSYRVLRGGGWSGTYFVTFGRCAFRLNYYPSVCYSDGGFRLAR